MTKAWTGAVAMEKQHQNLLYNSRGIQIDPCFWCEKAFWMTVPFTKQMKMLEKHYFDVLNLKCFLFFLLVMFSKQWSSFESLVQSYRFNLESVRTQIPHTHFAVSPIFVLLLFIQFIMYKRSCFTYIFSFSPHDYTFRFLSLSPFDRWKQMSPKHTGQLTQG